MKSLTKRACRARGHGRLAGVAALAALLSSAGCPKLKDPGEQVVDAMKYPTTRMRQARSAQLQVLTIDLATKSGQVSTLTLTVAPNRRGRLDVNISESMAAGTGESLRAALWRASFSASSLVGRPLIEYSISLRCTDAIDGSSVGALLTSALMAAMVGAELKSDVSLTGSLLPGSAVGPVGGIPQKLEAAIRAGIKTIGYPVGMRHARDLRTGKLVDLEQVAADNGARAVEIATVHDAFTLLTGRTFGKPAPIDRSKLALSAKMRERIAKTAAATIEATQTLLAGVSADKPQRGEPEKAEDPREVAQKQLARARKKLDAGRPATALTLAQKARRAAFLARLLHDQRGLLAKPEERQLAERLLALRELLGQLQKEALERRYQYQHSFSESHWNVVSYQRLIAAFCFALDAARQTTMAIALTRVLEGKPPLPEHPGASDESNPQAAAERKQLEQALAKLDKKQMVEQLPDLIRVVLAYEAFGWSNLQVARDYRQVDLRGADTAKNQTPELDEQLLQEVSKMYIQASRANLVYYKTILQQTARTLPKRELALHARLAALVTNAWAVPDQVIAPRWGEKAASTAMVRLAGAKESFLDASFLIYRAVYPTMENNRAHKSILARGDAIVRRLALFAETMTGTVPMSARLYYQVARDFESDGDPVSAVEMYWRAALEAHFSVLLARVLKRSIPTQPDEDRPDQPLGPSRIEHMY